MPKRKEGFRENIGRIFHLTLSLHHVNKRFEASFGLSLVQLYVLESLRQTPAVNLNVLAREVGVHASTLTQTIKRLSRKQYVLVIDDPLDQRKKVISLTRSGKEAIERIEPFLKET